MSEAKVSYEIGAENGISREEWDDFRRKVIRKLKFLEGLIDDAFLKLGEVDDRLTQNVDEAIDKADRAQRAVRRLKKEFDEALEE